MTGFTPGPADHIILRRLEDRPSWLRSLRFARAAWHRLAWFGLVEQVAPPGGGARNMLQLTQAGRDYLDGLDK